MTEELIELELIDANPWQPRETEDQEHVQKVADSIAARGLMQVPVGRRVDGRVQLAFGHTRLAAYKLLAKQDRVFDRMPVNVKELSNQEMFEEGVSENIDRKDLTPIEEAKAMVRYRDEFGKTSAEIGALFGLNESTVRNKMRLVELPEQVQGLVADGTLGEMTARKIMSVEKILPGTGTQIAQGIATSGVTSPARINDQIENHLRAKGTMMYSARYGGSEGEPKGGSGLWPLTWTPPDGIEPRKVKFELFKTVYEGPEEFVAEIQLGPSQQSIVSDRWTLKQIFDKAINQWDTDYMRPHLIKWGAEEVINVLNQLIRPPACTACSFCLRLDGSYWCMMETCWKNKKQAWMQAEMIRISEELKIPIYDREKDGAYEDLSSQWSANQQGNTWFNSRVDHLRLRLNYSQYGTNYLTNSAVVCLVSVRKEIQEKKQEEKERTRIEKEHEDNKEKHKVASMTFLKEIVMPVIIAQLLDHFEHAGAIMFLCANYSFDLPAVDLSNPTDPGTIERVKFHLIEKKVIEKVGYSSELYLGPVMTAKKLQQLLPTWGVKISGDLVQMAKEYELETKS